MISDFNGESHTCLYCMYIEEAVCFLYYNTMSCVLLVGHSRETLMSSLFYFPRQVSNDRASNPLALVWELLGRSHFSLST